MFTWRFILWVGCNCVFNVEWHKRKPQVLTTEEIKEPYCTASPGYTGFYQCLPQLGNDSSQSPEDFSGNCCRSTLGWQSKTSRKPISALLIFSPTRKTGFQDRDIRIKAKNNPAPYTETFSNLFLADNVKAAAHRFSGEIYEPVRKATKKGGSATKSKSQDKKHVLVGFKGVQVSKPERKQHETNTYSL